MAWTCLVATALAVIFTASRVHSTSYVYDSLVGGLTAVSRKDVIPKTSLDKPVKLSLDLTLLNINDVNTKTHEVSVDAWLSMTWESGLAYDPSKYNNLTDVRIPRSKVWVPDMVMYNGDMVFHDMDTNTNSYVIVWHSGTTTWVPPVKIRAICNIEDVSLFSNTTCNVKIGSWVYSTLDLSLEEETRFDLDSYFTEESAFEVLEGSAKKESKTYACCEEVFEDILFSFTFHKK